MDPAELEFTEPAEPARESNPISNDEFLSQLAGKEIERLLAEVDQQIDAALAAEESQPHAPSAALALRKYPERVSQPALPEVVEGDASEPPREERRSKSSSIIWDDQGPAEPPIAARVHMSHGALVAADSVPAYLKPLEWMNAPFEGISPHALGIIGKLAIVTFLTGIAAVVYVIMMR